MITADQLAQAMPKCPDPQAWATAITDAQAKWGIQDGNELAHFLGQLAVECSQFNTLTENLNYSAKGLASTWPNRYSSGKDAQGHQTPNALARHLERKPEAIANNCYAGRMGNGDEASGDGWKYRGRGCIMVTGRDAYQRYGQASGHDVVNDPDLLTQPEDAVGSAGWFWTTKHGLQHAARSGDVAAVTKLVNGGSIGLADRQTMTVAMTSALA